MRRARPLLLPVLLAFAATACGKSGSKSGAAPGGPDPAPRGEPEAPGDAHPDTPGGAPSPGPTTSEARGEASLPNVALSSEGANVVFARSDPPVATAHAVFFVVPQRTTTFYRIGEPVQASDLCAVPHPARLVLTWQRRDQAGRQIEKETVVAPGELIQAEPGLRHGLGVTLANDGACKILRVEIPVTVDDQVLLSSPEDGQKPH